MNSSTTFGQYRLIRQLGRGGMAEVFLSMVAGPAGSGFTKLAVLKRLRQNLAEDPEFVSMLVDEARITARMNHPNIVQTLEVGVEGGEYFVALEYLDGQPLHRIQSKAKEVGSTLSRELGYSILAEALAGLHYAHDLADYDGTPLGIVHRGVTPRNIFVTYEGIVKVVDFGVAKAVGRAAETKQGIVKGNVRYMSPEQAVGHAVDRRADIFAAGIVLWEAATGERFWGSNDEMTIVQALITGEFDASPRRRHPSVPAAVDAMCRKAIAFDRNDRYATAAEFRSELDAYLAEGIVEARRQIGPFAASLFEADRKAVREEIERASRGTGERASVGMADADEGSGSELTARAEAPAENGAALSSLSPFIVAASGPKAGDLPRDVVVTARPKLRRSPKVVAGIASFLALGSLFLVAATNRPTVQTAATALSSHDAVREAASDRSPLEVSSRAAKSTVETRATRVPESPRSAKQAFRATVPAPARNATEVATAPASDAKPRAPKPSIDTGDPWAAN